jgi:hypothetical protein
VLEAAIEVTFAETTVEEAELIAVTCAEIPPSVIVSVIEKGIIEVFEA